MLHYHTTLPSFLTPASDDALLHLQTRTHVPVHARAMNGAASLKKGRVNWGVRYIEYHHLSVRIIKLTDVECSTVHCPKVVCFLCFHLWRVYVYKSLAII